MARSGDMSGNHISNPFDFQQFHMSKIENQCTVDGISIHNKTYKPYFETGTAYNPVCH